MPGGNSKHHGKGAPLRPPFTTAADLLHLVLARLCRVAWVAFRVSGWREACYVEEERGQRVLGKEDDEEGDS